MNKLDKELIDEKFTGVHALIISNADVQAEVNRQILSTLRRIEEQTIKTNGRVFLLEKFQWTLTGKIIGISSVIGLLFGVVTFLMGLK